MYLEAKETARLYKLLSDQLGNDTTEAMFKYIDNKTERSVEATIKTLATKDDLALIRKEISEAKIATKDDLSILRKEIGELKIATKDEISDLRKEMGEGKADTIKWMFIFWVGQVAATLGIVLLFLKK